MSTEKQTPVSLFAQFVQGDIKGGAHAQAFRTTTIRNAVEQMFKGNYSPITEAAALTEGKAKKARAYQAGFATFGVVGTDVKKVDYKGKLDSAENKDVRAKIEQLTHAATVAFFVAFDAVMAEKAAPKAKSEPAPAAAPAPAPVASDDDVALVDASDSHSIAVELDDAVESMVAAIAGGMLTGAQLDAIYEACAARYTAQALELSAELEPA
jgi:hypothetical protein